MMFNLKSNVDENQLKVINAEKTRLLYSSLAVSLYATIAASVCFSAVQWDVVPHSRIIIWQTLTAGSPDSCHHAAGLPESAPG